MKIFGCILAGGLSRRMGQDKALLPWQGESTLLGHISKLIRPQVQDLIINANGDLSRFNLNYPMVKDLTDDYAGPLAGVCAGLDYMIQHSDAEYLFTAPCDAPFIPQDCVKKLSQAITNNQKIIVASSNGQNHPVIALWHKSLYEPLKQAYMNGIHKIEKFSCNYNPIHVIFDYKDIDPFTNINYIEEYHQYQRNQTTKD